MSRLSLLIFLIFVIASASEAKGDQRNWMEGTITNAELREVGPLARQIPWPIYWPTIYRPRLVWIYTIEAETVTYELVWGGRRPLNVTVHGKTKLASGSSGIVYLLDDDGKERKLTLFKKTARPSPGTPKLTSAGVAQLRRP